MKINLRTNPSEAELERVREHLIEYNRPFIGHVYSERFVLDIIEDGALQAGMIFRIRGKWLEIEFLTIDEKHRGQGLGQQLMDKAESFAHEKGCRFSSVYTFSFQARPFYEKLGYEVVYTQHDYPDVGQQKFYLSKEI